MKKIYFYTNNDSGGVFFSSRRKDDENTKYIVRFAGNPKFILEKLISKLGKEKGIEIFKLLLECFNDVNDEKHSSIVMYKRKFKK